MNENYFVISGPADLIISREADVRLTSGFLCWVSEYLLLRVRPVPTHAGGSAAREACRLRGVVHGYILGCLKKTTFLKSVGGQG